MNYIKSENINIDDLAIPLVVSFDNEPKENTNTLIKTLNKNKWDYFIIGIGLKWKGFITKITNYMIFLKNLPPKKIVVLTDARDVLCCRHPKAFIDGFYSLVGLNNSKILVSAELFLEGEMNYSEKEINNKNLVQGVPLTEYWNYHNISNLPYRKYVNSGLMCGKAEDLLAQFEWALLNNYTDDQMALAKYTNTFPDRVVLDVDANILHTSTFGVCNALYNIHIQKLDSPTFAEFFGRGAFFLHIPGLKLNGQSVIYEHASKIIESGACHDELNKKYGHNIPEWNQNINIF